MPNTEIKTFLTYKHLFSHIEKGGLLIPTSYLKDANNVNSLIDDLIKEFDNSEGVSYSSFLNAITQTYNATETEKFGLNEITRAGLVKNKPNSGIVFHRDNLLYIIIKLIKKKSGDSNITGTGNNNNARDYYKALLLASELIPNSSLEKDIFIKDYPYYYIPETTGHIYEIRLQRYWYIYNELFKKTKQKKNHIQSGIQAIEKKSGISLKDYFRVVSLIYFWFLKIPDLKKVNSNKDLKKMGFDCKSRDTFYIRKNNFGNDHELLKLVNHLAIDLKQFRKEFKTDKNRKSTIKGFYENFQTLFDYPIFKIDKDNHCIIDLKFLLDGLCSGFMWHINKFSKSGLQLFKGQYGDLLEFYFIELLKKIFGSKNVEKPTTDGNPDAILETANYKIILEFTTEYYLFTSIYNEKISELKDDLHRLLFNSGEKDPKARGKKEKGKFLNLNQYIEKNDDENKTVIPVLVTENYLGDVDLLDRFDNFISNNINKKGLKNLQKYKPIILNLDDFEWFWQIANTTDTVDQFAECIKKWESNTSNKGKYHFNFSFFCSNDSTKTKVNSEFKNFFNFQKYMKNLKID